MGLDGGRERARAEGAHAMSERGQGQGVARKRPVALTWPELSLPVPWASCWITLAWFRLSRIAHSLRMALMLIFRVSMTLTAAGTPALVS